MEPWPRAHGRLHVTVTSIMPTACRPFSKEAKTRGWASPRIIGHVNVLPRMKRYVETEGYNSIINSRQFNVETKWPTQYQAPTRRSRTAMRSRSRTRFELHHAKGETDDHAWVFLPQTKTLCTGDLFIWAAPNAGNPREGCSAMRSMGRRLRGWRARAGTAAARARLADRRRRARARSAARYRARISNRLCAKRSSGSTQGMTVYNILDAVRPPAELATKPYLSPCTTSRTSSSRNLVPASAAGTAASRAN
jgi:hypothetical protein